jgi:hypothetical protein
MCGSSYYPNTSQDWACGVIGHSCISVILDIDLHEHGIPLVYTSKHEPAMIVEPHRSMRWFEKPIDLQEVVQAILA